MDLSVAPVEPVPPPIVSSEPAASGKGTKPPRKRAKRAPALDEQPGRVSLLLRSTTGKTMLVNLSEPASDEECSITLERMAVYRLSFVPGDDGVVKGRPLLTKASLQCGHSFSAMALLYHFAQNSMTCPCCRTGHAGVRMRETSIPGHVRRHFLKQLDQVRAEERREQIETDSVVAASIMEREVNHGAGDLGFEMFLRVSRVVLILYAYETVDSLAPALVQELPLSSSSTQEHLLTFTSSGFYLREMARNMRFMRVGAFEAVVATRNLFDGVMELHRSMRFQPSVMGEGGVVAGAVLVEGVEMRVEMLAGARAGEISKFAWAIPRVVFANMLVQSLRGEMENTSVVDI